MTAQELITMMNDSWGMNQWPRQIEVNKDTFYNVFEFLLKGKIKNGDFYRLGNGEIGQYYEIHLQMGVNKGILFKNVELLVTEDGI